MRLGLRSPDHGNRFVAYYGHVGSLPQLSACCLPGTEKNDPGFCYGSKAHRASPFTSIIVFSSARSICASEYKSWPHPPLPFVPDPPAVISVGRIYLCARLVCLGENQR